MYIIVVGGGKVGYYLAKTLVEENHEVLVIEQDARKCDRIQEELGSVVLRGDGCEAVTLRDAGAGRADMLIAVTGDDEDNLVSAQVAKAKFNVPRTIARINNPRNQAIFKKLGIDVTVSSTDIILAHIEQELPTHPLVCLLELKGVGLEMVEVKVTNASPVAGKTLKNINLPPDSLISLVVSAQKGAQVPTADTVLTPGDEIVAVTKPENEAALRRVLTGA